MGAGLIRLGNHVAYLEGSPNTNGDSYRRKRWRDDISILELLERMEFPSAGVDYFRSRIAFFAPPSRDLPSTGITSRVDPPLSDPEDDDDPLPGYPAVPPGRRLPGLAVKPQPKKPNKLEPFTLTGYKVMKDPG